VLLRTGCSCRRFAHPILFGTFAWGFSRCIEDLPLPLSSKHRSDSEDHEPEARSHLCRYSARGLRRIFLWWGVLGGSIGFTTETQVVSGVTWSNGECMTASQLFSLTVFF